MAAGRDSLAGSNQNYTFPIPPTVTVMKGSEVISRGPVGRIRKDGLQNGYAIRSVVFTETTDGLGRRLAGVVSVSGRTKILFGMVGCSPSVEDPAADP